MHLSVIRNLVQCHDQDIDIEIRYRPVYHKYPSCCPLEPYSPTPPPPHPVSNPWQALIYSVSIILSLKKSYIGGISICILMYSLFLCVIDVPCFP